MTTAPDSLKPARGRWTTLVSAATVVAVAAVAFTLPSWWRHSRAVSKPDTPTTITAGVRTVPDGEAGAVGDLTITSEAMQLAEIKIAPVVRRQIREQLPVSGSIEAGGDRIAKLTPRTAGKIARVMAIVGDQVRAGQTLAIIESPELAKAQAAYRDAGARLAAAQSNVSRQRELARLGAFGAPAVEDARTRSVDADEQVRAAQQDVEVGQASLSEAQSAQSALDTQIESALAQVTLARSRAERSGMLYREQLVSRQENDENQAALAKAESDLKVARASAAQGAARVRSAQAQVSAATNRVALAKRRAGIVSESRNRQERVFRGGFLASKEIVDAESSLRTARLDRQAATESVRLLGGTPGGGSAIAIVSPIDGRVEERAVTLGESVDSERALFTVVNLGMVWANLQVPARDLPRVQVGMPVELSAESAPGRSFAGKVSSLGATTNGAMRTVTVRVALRNTGDQLRPGVFVRGGLVTDIRRNQVAVPDGAIQEHTGRKTLYVAQGNKPGVFEVRHVVLGESAGDGLLEVRSGLTGNERIAVSGTFYLKSEALKNLLSDGCCAVEVKKE